MPSIERHPTTAGQLTRAAQPPGLSVDGFIRSLFSPPGGAEVNHAEPKTEFDFDMELDAVLMRATSLRADFSRADIYQDPKR